MTNNSYLNTIYILVIIILIIGIVKWIGMDVVEGVMALMMMFLDLCLLMPGWLMLLISIVIGFIIVASLGEE